MRLLTGLLAYRMATAWQMAYGLACLGHLWYPGFRRMPERLADEATDAPRRQRWRDMRRHITGEWRRWNASGL